MLLGVVSYSIVCVPRQQLCPTTGIETPGEWSRAVSHQGLRIAWQPVAGASGARAHTHSLSLSKFLLFEFWYNSYDIKLAVSKCIVNGF